MVRKGHANPYSRKNILILSWEFIFVFAPNICELPLLHSQSCNRGFFGFFSGWFFGPYLLLLLLSLKQRSSQSQRSFKSLNVSNHQETPTISWWEVILHPCMSPLKMQQSWGQVSSSITAETHQGYPGATARRMMKVWRWTSRDLGLGHGP